MEQFKILLVDSDVEFATIMQDCFVQEGYMCKLAKDGLEAVEMLQRESFSLCILDVVLPVKDGFEVAAYINSECYGTLFLYCSSRMEKKYKLRGLRIGAEDFLIKPIDIEELLLKVANIKRRSIKKEIAEKENVIVFSKFTFNCTTRLLKYEGDDGEEKNEKLTAKEAAMLRVFLENKNQLLAREEILRKVWLNNNDYTRIKGMDIYITKLRKYLSLDKNISILNHHGKGFRFAIEE